MMTFVHKLHNKRRLFYITYLPNGMISNFGSWVDGKWIAALQTNKPDSWEWRHDKSKMFTIRSAYSILTSHDQVLATPYNDLFLLWKSRAPLKVLSFAWRLFQNRIPTKDALLRRGFSSSDGGGDLALSKRLYLQQRQPFFTSYSGLCKCEIMALD
ncbi:hypothetical protein Lal_00032767 [Lupinus albus]|nr:hypothetical protein Lal_00032767 [Lupinus albus]